MAWGQVCEVGKVISSPSSQRNSSSSSPSLPWKRDDLEGGGKLHAGKIIPEKDGLPIVPQRDQKTIQGKSPAMSNVAHQRLKCELLGDGMVSATNMLPVCTVLMIDIWLLGWDAMQGQHHGFAKSISVLMQPWDPKHWAIYLLEGLCVSHRKASSFPGRRVDLWAQIYAIKFLFVWGNYFSKCSQYSYGLQLLSK